MNSCIYYYRTRLSSFVDFAFRELHHGDPMRDNWHIRLMASLLEFSWLDEQPDVIRRQIFNLPPGYMKTHVCSISFPAWVLGRDPRKSVLIVSESPESALDIQERCAELMMSKRYQSIFPRARVSRNAARIELSYGGGIRHAGINQSLPHRKSDLVIFDNPQSLHNLDRLNLESFVEIGRTLREPNRGVMVLATRRLGKNDLSEFLRRRAGWGGFAFPAIALRQMTFDFPPLDFHQQNKGEPLYPAFEDWLQLEDRLVELGGLAFAYQYMQGCYLPQTSGQRDAGYIDGYRYTMVGTFDPTAIAQDDLGKLKQQYLENLSV